MLGGRGLRFDHLVARGGSWTHTRWDAMYDQMSSGRESDNVYVEHLAFYADERRPIPTSPAA